MSRPPKIVVPGLNRGAGIPAGYILGRRPGTGQGPAELLTVPHLVQMGLAKKSDTNQGLSTTLSTATSAVGSLSASVSTTDSKESVSLSQISSSLSGAISSTTSLSSAVSTIISGSISAVNSRVDSLSAAGGSGGAAVWGSISGTLSNQADLSTVLSADTASLSQISSSLSGAISSTSSLSAAVSTVDSNQSTSISSNLSKINSLSAAVSTVDSNQSTSISANLSKITSLSTGVSTVDSNQSTSLSQISSSLSGAISSTSSLSTAASTSYVLKAGDTMVGNLLIVASGLVVSTAGRSYIAARGSTGAGVIELSTGAADADGTVVGIIQFSDVNSSGRAGQIRAIQNGGTANNRGGKLIFSTKANGSSTVTDYMVIDQGGNVVFAFNGALATNATQGFTYIPSCAGIPTGVPVSFTGAMPIVYDSTDDSLYIYNTSWKVIGGGGAAGQSTSLSQISSSLSSEISSRTSLSSAVSTVISGSISSVNSSIASLSTAVGGGGGGFGGTVDMSGYTLTGGPLTAPTETTDQTYGYGLSHAPANIITNNFWFRTRAFSGDLTVIARILLGPQTTGNNSAGIVFRQSGATTFVAGLVSYNSPSMFCETSKSTNDGASSTGIGTSLSGPSGTVPVYIKAVYIAGTNTLTISVSNSGLNWIQTYTGTTDVTPNQVGIIQRVQSSSGPLAAAVYKYWSDSGIAATWNLP